MTPDELAQIIDGTGETRQRVAFALGVNIATLFRWMAGTTRIPSGHVIVLRAIDTGRMRLWEAQHWRSHRP